MSGCRKGKGRIHKVGEILSPKGLPHSDAIDIFYRFMEKIGDFPFTDEPDTVRIARALAEIWEPGEFETFKKTVLDRSDWERHFEV